MFHRLGRILASMVIVAAGLIGVQAALGPAANADACYTWDRTLRQGDTGADVEELQERVAAYHGRGGLVLDGVFGPATDAAVKRFQQEYGLAVDGIAGSQTYGQIYALQDADCTPAHFSYSELNQCNSTWAGGPLSASATKSNAREVMWKLEALRHGLGDHPIRITSGFRSYSCNNAAGGVSSSRHLYGDAADMGNLSHSLCTIAREARSYGFYGILGPGFPNHNDHIHVASKNGSRSAPWCF